MKRAIGIGGAFCKPRDPEALRDERYEADPSAQATADGRFGQVMDPEGNRAGLSEPPPVRP